MHISTLRGNCPLCFLVICVLICIFTNSTFGMENKQEKNEQEEKINEDKKKKRDSENKNKKKKEKNDNNSIKDLDSSKYSPTSLEIKIPDSKVFNSRRLFNWKNLQHFLSSFSNGVEVNFGNVIKASTNFKGNIEKKKILIVGAGLKYDDDVKDSQILFADESLEGDKDRESYYPFNAYLIDKDGTYMGTFLPSFGNTFSFADASFDIGKKNINNEEFFTQAKEQFDTVIFELLDNDAYTQTSFKNVSELLKGGGQFILNCPIKFIAASQKELENSKYIKAKIPLKSELAEETIIKETNTQFLYLKNDPTSNIFNVYFPSTEKNNNPIKKALKDHIGYIVFTILKEQFEMLLKECKFTSIQETTEIPADLVTKEKLWYSSLPDRFLIFRKEEKKK